MSISPSRVPPGCADTSDPSVLTEASSPAHPLTRSPAQAPLPEPFLSSDLARLLPELRPDLLRFAASRRPCRHDDADDLVAETVRLALLVLPEFRPRTGVDGLARWLTGILRCVILTDRQRAARRPRTVPIETVERELDDASIADTSDPSDTFYSPAGALAALPEQQRYLVRAWLSGHSQADLSRRLRVHRNTIANRLELAFQAIRIACPDSEDLVYSAGLLRYCSRVTVYRRPKAPWRSWFAQHPPDRRLTAPPRRRTAHTEDPLAQWSYPTTNPHPNLPSPSEPKRVSGRGARVEMRNPSRGEVPCELAGAPPTIQNPKSEIEIPRRAA